MAATKNAMVCSSSGWTSSFGSVRRMTPHNWLNFLRCHGQAAPLTRPGRWALYDLGCYCVSAARLFGGHPTRVWAEPVLDAAAGPDGGVDLRLAATIGLPGQVLALFDVGLDLTRRGELELVGTGAG
jgi:hypothetical protein